MNEILILKRTSSDADDGMFVCQTGTISCGDFQENIAVFGDQCRVDGFVDSYLRGTGKSVDEYSSTEEVIRDFLDYCTQVILK